jgi:hypothetical protein
MGENMNNDSFIPHYEIKMVLSFIIIAIMVIVLPIIYTFKSTQTIPTEIWISEIFFASILLFIPFMLVRKIELKEKVIVKRYLYPGYDFDYSDIISFDLSVIKIRGKRPILLRNMKNANILIQKIGANKKENTGNQLEINTENIKKQIIVSKASIYSAIISFAISLIVLFSGIIPRNWQPKLVSFAIWIVVYFIIYLILINRERSK